jgi:peptide/nickel transport system substrate-binding protein
MAAQGSVRIVTALAALAIAGGVMTGCTASPADEGTTSIRIGVNPSNLAARYDPATAFIHATDTSGLYESFFTGDTKTGELEPLLATSYELSDDRKTLTVELRDDVKFVGGDPMTADAVVEFFNLLAADEESGLFTPAADFGATFEATGEYSIKVTTTGPMDVPGVGLYYFVLGTHIANPKSMADREAAATSPQGTGPYLVDEIVPEVSVKLVRNPDYWNPEAYPFDEVEILAFDDDVARLNALTSGQVDAASLGLSFAQEATEADFNVNLSPNGGRFTALWIADRAGTIVPALADRRVREAMQLAFDREAINETINQGYGLVTSQLGNPATDEYVEGGDDRYGYDPERARELMAEAGYADGFDLAIPSTTFLGVNAWEPVVTQSLADIGIRVTIDSYADAGAWFTEAMSGRYPVIMYSEQPGDALRVFLTPDALFNGTKYMDPVIAEAWDAVLTGTTDEMKAALTQIGERTLDEAWMVVFASTPVLWFSREGITVEVDGAGFPHLDQFGVD